MKTLIAALASVLFAHCSFGQLKYNLRAETGILRFQHNIFDYDAGPNWKGQYLNESQNGLSFDIVNGISLKDKLFVGVGIGYLNFEGIHGYSAFADLQYLLLKGKLTPFLNLKIGTSHIWNQYEDGTRSGLVELNVGVNYKLKNRYSLYVKSGILFMQQALIIPVRLGITLR